MGWDDSGDSSGTRDSWGGGTNKNDAANQRGYGGSFSVAIPARSSLTDPWG